MAAALNDDSLDQIFRAARTHNGWTPARISEDLMRRIYDLAKMGPTAANGSPARFVFVVSAAAKAKLKPCLAPGNVAKTMAAPVTVLVGYDTRFHDHLPTLFPHTNAKAWFEGNTALIEETGLRNSSLQGAYLMLAARSLGLDCGPMSGFDPVKLGEAFWPDGRIKPNFICNIGYGDPAQIHPRNPRLSFEQACQVL